MYEVGSDDAGVICRFRHRIVWGIEHGIEFRAVFGQEDMISVCKHRFHGKQRTFVNSKWTL
jgi:hypothetical protein